MKKSKSGQSTIEFILSFSIVLGVFFLFIKMAINYVDGYLIHYATYMASRTYLTADSDASELTITENVAMRMSKKVFDGIVIQGFSHPLSKNLKFNQLIDVGGKHINDFVGVYVDFKQTFSPLSFVGGKQILNMRSESFLGKEPPKQECLDRICKATEKARQKSGMSCNQYSTFFDDGC